MFLLSMWCCKVCVSKWSVGLLFLLFWWHLGSFCPCFLTTSSEYYATITMFFAVMSCFEFSYHCLFTYSSSIQLTAWHAYSIHHFTTSCRLVNSVPRASGRLSKQLRGLQLITLSLWQFKCCLMCWHCLPGTCCCWCDLWLGGTWRDWNSVSGRRIVAVDQWISHWHCDHKD